jgi:hypothetical protein
MRAGRDAVVGAIIALEDFYGGWIETVNCFDGMLEAGRWNSSSCDFS